VKGILMKKIISGLLLVSFLIAGMIIPVACSDENGTNGAVGEPPDIADTDEDKEGAGQTDSNNLVSTAFTYSDDRLIIHNGNISIVVQDINTSLDEIALLADYYEGYVVSSSISGEDYEMRGWISIRVPAEDFEMVLEEIGELAEKITDKSTSSQDVTEEYIDLAARLANAEATETQYLTLLDMAQDVNDVLNIYNALSNVRQEIEQLEARIQYLERTAEMALIYTFLEPTSSGEPIVDSDWDIVEILKDAARGIVVFGEWLVTGLVWALLFSPLWGTALFFGIRYWKKRRTNT